jgi:hypothetical protein
MAYQDSGSVSITGGSIDGTTIGGTAAAAVTGTTITANTQFSGAGTGLTGTAASLSIGGTAALATAVAGGAANEIVYQTGAGVSAFATAPTVDGTILSWTSAGGFAWASPGGTGTVTSVSGSGGTTGLTLTGGPITSSGTLTLGGTLGIANGGTGQVTAAAAFQALSPIAAQGDLIVGGLSGVPTNLTIGTNGQVLTSNGTTATWAAPAATGVTTFSAGTTGFTPSTATSGGITLAGTLNVSNGGTGATTLTGYVYGNGSGAMTASSTIPTTSLSGTVTNAQLANSSLTINGNSVSLGGSTTVTADTTAALTFDNSGTGSASGTTFNGSTAYTISYNTLGASPVAGSASIVTVGTITSGVWNGTSIANANLANSSITFGGTAAALGTTVSVFNAVDIGTTTAGAGKFTTLSSTGNTSFSGSNAAISIQPTGTGTVTIDPATAGTIDNVVIGGTTPAAGTFTTLTANGNVNLNGSTANISLQPGSLGSVTINPTDPGTMDSMVIGSNSPVAGTFTLLTTTQDANINGIDVGQGANSAGNSTAIGTGALSSATTGAGNTAGGYQSLINLTTGSGNTAYGYQAGSAVTGSNNTIIGLYTGAAGPISDTGSNWIVLSDGNGNVPIAANGATGEIQIAGTSGTAGYALISNGPGNPASWQNVSATDVYLTAGAGATNYITFASGATGSQAVNTDTSLTYNATTHALTSGLNGGTF